MSKKTIYALGFFDGVHLGHGALLNSCRELAEAMECRSGVITFSNHPDTLVHGVTPGLITTEQDRNTILTRDFRMERVVSLPFDRKMMEMPWERFFRMLVEEYDAGGFVCGEDFRFGYRGEGNAMKLLEICRREEIPCVVEGQLKMGGMVISSTYIRNLVEMGLMERAIHFLGHPYVLTGTVVPGQQLGRRLGVPTANLMLPPELAVPKFGVYACKCLVDGKRYAAVTNVGTRPTVDGVGVTVEPWIQDFSGDLYGREITLEFYKFLRPEIRFDSLKDLQQAIRQDAADTKKFLSTIYILGWDKVLFSEEVCSKIEIIHNPERKEEDHGSGTG